MSSKLFTPLKLREVECRNRVFVSPMCQYTAEDGMPNDWHLVHLGSRAVGGAGMVIAEATAVSPEGRISPGDVGIWSDHHAQAWERIAAFLRGQGSVPAVQLAHAGRKASTAVPWEGGKGLNAGQGGWQPLAPSPVAFDEHYPVPREMTRADMDMVAAQFVDAARRSLRAGFEAIELHMAHGYLMHEFLSPLSNHRTDEFGGSLENRVRYPLQVARAVRAAWPERLPLLVRISATDWAEGGWDLEQSVEFARQLREAGMDLIDCSSGGLVPNAKIVAGPGYQTPFAAVIRRETGIPTGAVGFIRQPFQAEQIVATGLADVVLLAREMLRDPYWPLHAAKALHADMPWPAQYDRAKIE